VVLDQVEAGREARLGEVGRRRGHRGGALLGDLDDDAVGGARVQEGLAPVRIGQVDADGFEAGRADPGQRVRDVGDEEVEVVRARAAGGQEAVEERRVGTAGGGQQLDFRARGELQLAPPVSGGVAAVGPRSAQHAAEQVPAVRQARRPDGEVIEHGNHGTAR
jgi:hypothetical protein